MSRCKFFGVSRVIALLIAATVGVLFWIVSAKPPGVVSQYNNLKISGIRVLDESNLNSVSPGAFAADDGFTSRKGISYSLENTNTAVGLDYLSRIQRNCSTKTCSQFLTQEDEPHFRYCIKKTWKASLRDYTEPSRSTCIFINGSSRHPMALASYPGSGNTWVRGLLQKTTGLCTGAIYCDVTLRKNGFPGESIRSGVTFLVKTHQTDPRWQSVKYKPSDPFLYFKKLRDVPVFAGGVFIIRNPFHAMVAEFKRLMWEDEPDNHVLTLGLEYFGNHSKWNSFVAQESITWKDTVLGWLGPRIRPVLLVRYEDFKLNPKFELERILHFLQVPYRRGQLELVLKEGFDEYRRPRPRKKLQYYTPAQKKLVRDSMREVQRKLELDLTSYLEP